MSSAVTEALDIGSAGRRQRRGRRSNSIGRRPRTGTGERAPVQVRRRSVAVGVHHINVVAARRMRRDASAAPVASASVHTTGLKIIKQMNIVVTKTVLDLLLFHLYLLPMDEETGEG